MELQAVLWNESHTSLRVSWLFSLTSAVNEGRVNLGTQNLSEVESGWSELCFGEILYKLYCSS